MMTADPLLSALLADEVQVVPRVLMDKYGGHTRKWPFTDAFTDAFGATTTAYPCRVQDATERMGGPQRDDGARGKVYILGDAAISVDDLLILPDGSQPVIRSVSHVPDDTGPHHTVVEFDR